MVRQLFLQNRQLQKKVLQYGLLTLTVISISSVMGEEKKRSMANEDEYIARKVIPSSILHEFAGWFHQDWQLMSSNYIEHTKLFINSAYTNHDKSLLKKELQYFLSKNEGLSKKEMTNKWYELGANNWDHKSIDIRNGLKEILKLLSRTAHP